MFFSCYFLFRYSRIYALGEGSESIPRGTIHPALPKGWRSLPLDPGAVTGGCRIKTTFRDGSISLN